MNIPEARKQLTRSEMETVTTKAIGDGPFVIKKISKLGAQKEVHVEYPKTKRTKVIILESYGG